nr:neurotrypsin-like [Penaeus vannamei]
MNLYYCILEVNGVWGFVCDDGFGFPEADLVCREIGHEGAEMFTRNNKFGASAKGIAGVVCRSIKSRCSDEEFPCGGDKTCLKREKVCDGESDCPDNSDEKTELCEHVGVVRLRPGDRPFIAPGLVAGLVQVKRQGKWLPLCDSYLRVNDSKVLCKNLGYTNGWTLPYYGSYLGEDPSPVSVSVRECTGEESWIGDCPSLNWEEEDCTPESTAAVMCSDGPVTARIEGGNPERGGLLKVKLKGREWNGVCGDAFDDLDAKVICRMSGYRGDAFASQEPRTSQDPLWDILVDCTGHESRLEQCRLKIADEGCTSVASVTCSRRAGGIDTQLRSVLPPNCGLVENSSNLYIGLLAKIRGGTTPSQFDSPWKVTLRLKKELEDGGRLICGGSIISEDLVLTAAHCFGFNGEQSMVVRSGDFDSAYVEGSFDEEFGIEQVWIHEQYEDTHFQDNDIALIRIERKWGRGFRFNKRVRPLCMPSADASYDDLGACTVSGWGRTMVFSQPTQRPNELEVGVYPDAVCEAYFGTYNYSSSSVCVGTENPFLKRPCGGDSGGALVCKRGNRDVLYGMVSAGPLCGVLSFSPDVFTRITKYIRWIQEKVAPFGYRPSFQERFNPFRPGGSFQW